MYRWPPALLCLLSLGLHKYNRKSMLSVVIPTKNEEMYLPNLLASLKKQSEQDFEVIVADANSTDKTKKIAESFGARVVDGGLPAVGRNRGAEASKGDLILFLDADVVLSDAEYLHTCLLEFKERQLDIATCKAVPLDGDFFDQVSHDIYHWYTRLFGTLLPHAAGFCILVRREIHQKVNGFDESIVFCEDHDYARRISKIGKFGFLKTEVPVSVRRFRRDGYFVLFIKFVLAELHLVFLGPIRRDIFRYTFGHK